MDIKTQCPPCISTAVEGLSVNERVSQEGEQWDRDNRKEIMGGEEDRVQHG